MTRFKRVVQARNNSTLLYWRLSKVETFLFSILANSLGINMFYCRRVELGLTHLFDYATYNLYLLLDRHDSLQSMIAS